MRYPDRSSNGKCVPASFTGCKTRDVSVCAILWRGVCPMPLSQAGRRGVACLLWEWGGGVRNTMKQQNQRARWQGLELRGWCLVWTHKADLTQSPRSKESEAWPEGACLHGRVSGLGLWWPGYLRIDGDCHLLIACWEWTSQIVLMFLGSVGWRVHFPKPAQDVNPESWDIMGDSAGFRTHHTWGRILVSPVTSDLFFVSLISSPENYVA